LSIRHSQTPTGECTIGDDRARDPSRWCFHRMRQESPLWQMSRPGVRSLEGPYTSRAATRRAALSGSFSCTCGWSGFLRAYDYRDWDSVPIVYDSRNADRAYRDTLEDVWGTQLTALRFHFVTLFGSFSEHRRS
jgi:hypothetical protein